MANPSLAMIPSGAKATKLYSVLPEDGTGDFTVVSDQKYVTGSTGLLELVPANTPAFDYSDGSGCPALLVEDTSTNLLTYSEDFSNAIWLKGGVTVTPNSIISPNGNLTADKIVETTNNVLYGVYRNIPSTGTYTHSIFAKAGERTWMRMNLISGADANIWFDLTNGVVGSNPNGFTYEIINYGNGWFKYSVTRINAATSFTTFIPSTGDGATTYTGDGTSGIYIWGAQLEVGSTATSYIKTEATTVTRIADVITVAPPAGVTSITETIGGVEQTPVLNIFPTYQIPNGSINKLIGTTSSGDSYDFISNYLIRATTDGATATEDELICLNDELTLDLVNYNNSSLYLNPTLGKASKLYSQKPTDGTGDFTVVRASTATRVNEDGLIETVAANVPRLDYTGGLTCPVLLTEPQSTNLITYPISFDNAYWTKTGSTVVGGQSSPSVDFPTSAFKLVESVGLSDHRISAQQQTLTANTYSGSFFAKKAERDVVQIFPNGSFDANAYANFDLTNGVVSASVSTSAKIELLSDGWYKCSYTFEGASVNASPMYISIMTSPTSSKSEDYTGDGTSGVYIFGIQLEQQSSATSFIYDGTEGSTTTRIADVITGAGDVNTFNSEEGTLFVEMAALSNDGTDRTISISDGTAGNSITIKYQVSVNVIDGVIKIGGVQYGLSANGLINISYNKVAVSYKLGEFKFYVNGVQISSTLNLLTIFSTSTLNTLKFQYPQFGLQSFYGKVKQLQVFKTTLTDAELISLTTL